MHRHPATNVGLNFLIAAACAAATCIVTGCAHGSSSQRSTNAFSRPASGSSGFTSGARPGAGIDRPAHPSDGYRLADIAVQRLGGPAAPNAPIVTGVSVVGAYGLTVYKVGSATQELLSLKEHGAWRPLGTDAYYPDGRGLVHFGLSQDLATKLISGLTPPPSR